MEFAVTLRLSPRGAALSPCGLSILRSQEARGVRVIGRGAEGRSAKGTPACGLRKNKNKRTCPKCGTRTATKRRNGSVVCNRHGVVR